MNVEVQGHDHTSNTQSNQLVLDHLKKAIRAYLAKRPHMSLNAVSKRCGVSEPTLRRIMSGKVKTLPQTTTLLDILSYIGDTQNIAEIIKIYQGPIGDYLKDGMLQSFDVDREYSTAVNKLLEDPNKYLIYKLSLNHMGLKEEKVLEMFGRHGLQVLNEMVDSGYIYRDEDGRYRSQIKTFHGSFDNFVRHFKAVADYIKPHKHQSRRPLNPFFANSSDSITPEAYEQILRLQRATQKKISKIISQPNSKGSIPVFYICAFDTLDFNSAHELDAKSQKSEPTTK